MSDVQRSGDGWLVPGALVEYQASKAQGRWYAAVVDEPPRMLGSNAVVRLRDLDPAYSRDHHPGQNRTSVAAASVECVRPRTSEARVPYDPSARRAQAHAEALARRLDSETTSHIASSRVISEPGASLEVTEYELTPEANAGLNIGNAKLGGERLETSEKRIECEGTHDFKFTCTVCQKDVHKLYGTTASLSMRCADCLWETYLEKVHCRESASHPWGEIVAAAVRFVDDPGQVHGDRIGDLTRAVRAMQDKAYGLVDRLAKAKVST